MKKIILNRTDLLDDVTVAAYRADDDAVVVQVDTGDATKKVQVYLGHTQLADEDMTS